jgi:hypothetical protein
MFFLERIRRWWRDRSRCIFQFHDGIRTRYADPVAVGTALELELPDYQKLLDTLAQKPDELPPGPLRAEILTQQHDTIKKLAAVARVVFKLAPVDDSSGWGATQAEAVRVIMRYFMFMQQLARDAELFPDSPGLESASLPV